MSLDSRIDALANIRGANDVRVPMHVWCQRPDGRAGETLDNRTPIQYLPLPAYSEVIDLHNLLRLLLFGMDRHGQAGIQSYSKAVAKIVMSLLSMTCDAFEDYRLNAVTLRNLNSLAHLIPHLGWG